MTLSSRDENPTKDILELNGEGLQVSQFMACIKFHYLWLQKMLKP